MCVFRIITTSSASEVLPARSPIPLIVTSTWRAPVMIPEMVSRRSHTEIVMTMNRYDGLVDILYIIKKILDTLAIKIGKTVAGSIGNVHNIGAGGNHRLRHLCEEREIGTARVFGVEFNFNTFALRIFHGLRTLLEYLLACAAELVLDVHVGWN